MKKIFCLFVVFALAIQVGCVYTDKVRMNVKPNQESIDFTFDFLSTGQEDSFGV